MPLLQAICAPPGQHDMPQFAEEVWNLSQHTLMVAMQESEVQAEYDNVLREAKLLRLDLQHALKNCLEHKVGKHSLALLGCLCDCMGVSMLMPTTQAYDLLMQG